MRISLLFVFFFPLLSGGTVIHFFDSCLFSFSLYLSFLTQARSIQLKEIQMNETKKEWKKEMKTFVLLIFVIADDVTGCFIHISLIIYIAFMFACCYSGAAVSHWLALWALMRLLVHGTIIIDAYKHNAWKKRLSNNNKVGGENGYTRARTI